MKIYSPQNVYEAALDRIRYLFDQFPNIVVNFSGGKDSTIVLQLALQVAEEKGRLPLPVLWIDQEAEWQATVDYVDIVMRDPRVKPYWLQIPMLISNSASSKEGQDWINCWGEGEDWIHPKSDISIQTNVYGTDRFAELFTAFLKHEFGTQKVAQLGGVRAEESPSRLRGLTTYSTYKWITWGKKDNPKHDQYSFYPIYDWSYTDVWKAIHDNGWAYNRVYDYMYRYGVPVAAMRVSSVIHETSLPNLFHMQETEPETWEKITRRLHGINAVGQMKKDFTTPKQLPYMFRDWAEYRDHLLENLVPDEWKRDKFRKDFEKICARYVDSIQPKLWKEQCKAILADDFHGTKMTVFAAAHAEYSKNRGKRGFRKYEEGQANE